MYDVRVHVLLRSPDLLGSSLVHVGSWGRTQPSGARPPQRGNQSGESIESSFLEFSGQWVGGMLVEHVEDEAR